MGLDWDSSLNKSVDIELVNVNLDLVDVHPAAGEREPILQGAAHTGNLDL